MACEALASAPAARLGDPTLVVTQAKAQAATAAEGRNPAMPAHCEVFAKMAERKGANGQTYAIKMHLRMPVDWNGRFFFQGGGGSNGVVGNALGGLLGGQTRNALSMGYAVVSQDSGHDNAVNNDPKLQGLTTFGWDPEARRNYGFASIGPVTRVAKAMIRAHYGRGPQFSTTSAARRAGRRP
jgi:feruloyl esterase